MNAYPAHLIIMTVVNKHTMKMKWSERSIVQTFVFGKTIHLFDSYSFLSFCFVPIAQLQMRVIHLEM